jgi:CubicO group peptidase (beta-lactamase class C family)
LSVTGRAQEEPRAQAARARDNLGVPVHAPDFSEVRKFIRDHMARDSVPGFAIAVSRGDSILWEEGFGWADREARIPATAQTPFYLASVTKTITATAVMMLRERCPSTSGSATACSTAP